MRLYYPRVYHRTLREQCWRALETVLKSTILIGVALIPTAISVAVWYYGVFRHEIHFHKELREVILMGWIPIFGLLYCIITGITATWVSGELKEIRIAVKRRDIERFMLYKDEDLSPVMHCVCAILAFFILVAVAGLEYPNFGSGAIAVGGMAFVFSFLCVVIIEMDDPCHGVWVVKSIPPEWRDVNAYAWRLKHLQPAEGALTEEYDPEEDPPSGKVTHILQHKPVGKRAKRRRRYG